MFTHTQMNFYLVWYYCLCILINFTSGNTETFDIRRGKVDTFSNLKCQKSSNCFRKQCENYGAICVNHTCERCQCNEDMGTFIVSGPSTGNCTRDEDIIPESGMNKTPAQALTPPARQE